LKRLNDPATWERLPLCAISAPVYLSLWLLQQLIAFCGSSAAEGQMSGARGENKELLFSSVGLKFVESDIPNIEFERK